MAGDVQRATCIRAKGRVPSLLLLTLLVVAPSSVVASADAEDVVVPGGEVRVASAWLEVKDLTVLGVLRVGAPGDWVIHARSIHVRAQRLNKMRVAVRQLLDKKGEPTGKVEVFRIA